MDRIERIRSLFDPRGVGLEIGPSHSPVAPKVEGFNVKVLDYLDAQGLRRKYGAAGVNVSKVEEVDFIGDGRPMLEVVGQRDVFDWIVASHVVEHVPDLVGFLKDCEAMLKPGGRLILAVPDKRYCFDVLRPLSTIGQAIQAHADRRTRPVPGVAFDDVAYARLREGRSGWLPSEVGTLGPARAYRSAWSLVDHMMRSEDYVDVHCWTFVPSSFRLIVDGLYLGAMSPLSVERMIDGGGEFFAVLQAAPPKEVFDLGQLAVAAAREDREAILTL